MGGRMMSGNDGGWWRGMVAARWGCARDEDLRLGAENLGPLRSPSRHKDRSHKSAIYRLLSPVWERPFRGAGPAAMGRAAAPGCQRDNASSDKCSAPGSLWASSTTTSPIQIAVAPPSTVRQCPVVNAAPSLHRYNTALAISATVPMRPTGCMAAANSALRGSAS